MANEHTAKILEALDEFDRSLQYIEAEWGPGRSNDELRAAGDEDVHLLDDARAAVTGLTEENARLTALVSRIKQDCELMKSEGVGGDPVSDYNMGVRMQSVVTLGLIEDSEAGA